MARRARKWWLSGGMLHCPACHDRYVCEMEVRCRACDGPLCPQCAVRIWETREWFCPACTTVLEVEERSRVEPGASL